VVCGLAGALAPGLPPGTVLIPERVGLADGEIMQCDPALVQALVTAARALHFRPDTRPLLTAQSLIVGSDRREWCQRGFAAADMETGLLAGRNLRVATIRVVLDSPEHGISPDWLRPTRALLQPSLWRELLWLSRMAPRYALRAAQVLKVGLGTGPGSMFVE
jgi:Phosphorylase superfamily